MIKRPYLDRNLDSKTFRDFYYLKEELVDFCRKNGLPASGGKIELTDRIAHFLDTGEIPSISLARKRAAVPFEIHEDTKIESDFVCSEKHRAFFKQQIGSSFSFNVAFQKWLKSNAGKTYQDAIAAYAQILEDKKKGRTEIDKQFEYNTYRSITDHNCVEGVSEVLSLSGQYGIQVIPGVELDCEHEGRGFHLLGYGFDHTKPVFAEIEQSILI